MSEPEVVHKLKAASAGLRWRSETDRPFHTVYWPKAVVPALTPAALLQLLNKPADTKVEQVALDYFFRNFLQVEAWQDEDHKLEVPRYQQLIRTLRENLADVRVFRVGRVEIDVYIVGRTAGGDWAGLQTFVVET